MIILFIFELALIVTAYLMVAAALAILAMSLTIWFAISLRDLLKSK